MAKLWNVENGKISDNDSRTTHELFTVLHSFSSSCVVCVSSTTSSLVGGKFFQFLFALPPNRQAPSNNLSPSEHTTRSKKTKSKEWRKKVFTHNMVARGKIGAQQCEAENDEKKQAQEKKMILIFMKVAPWWANVFCVVPQNRRVSCIVCLGIFIK